MPLIEKWITVNGQHIPIMKGESVGKALSNHFRERRKQVRDKKHKKILKEDDEEQVKIDRKYGHKGPTTRMQKEVEGGGYKKESDELASKTVNRIKELNRDKMKVTGVKKGLSQKEVDKVYKEEDYTDIINTLSRKDKTNLRHAYNDLDYYQYGSSNYRETKNYIDKIEAKAASLYTNNKRYTLKEDSNKLQINGHKRYYSPQTRKEQRELVEKYSRARNKKRKGELLAQHSATFDKVYTYKSESVRKAVVKKAYKDYLKEHPNSKMKLDTFLKTYKK